MILTLLRFLSLRHRERYCLLWSLQVQVYRSSIEESRAVWGVAKESPYRQHCPTLKIALANILTTLVLETCWIFWKRVVQSLIVDGLCM